MRIREGLAPNLPDEQAPAPEFVFKVDMIWPRWVKPAHKLTGDVQPGTGNPPLFSVNVV